MHSNRWNKDRKESEKISKKWQQKRNLPEHKKLAIDKHFSLEIDKIDSIQE